MQNDFKIVKVGLDDVIELQTLSKKTYMETFESSNTEENMKAYLEAAFNLEKLKTEIKTEGSTFYFLLIDEIVGYIKINLMPAQTDVYDDAALEVERLYTLKAVHGSGGGKLLMEKAFEMAKTLNKSYVWLGVWEHNERALSFYHKTGYYKIGTHDFIMGDDVQTDFLMRKDL